jgi:endonuclease/exonuclease/phosphatase family metal-dependent hydrolase
LALAGLPAGCDDAPQPAPPGESDPAGAVQPEPVAEQPAAPEPGTTPSGGAAEDDPAAPAPRQAGRPRAGSPPEPATAAEREPAAAGLRFVSLNLKNWLAMERYADGRRLPDRDKPAAEKDAVVATLAAARPDVLGVCEIGTPDDLGDLQQRLAAAGCDLPHRHHAGGGDETRHLALLSRLPLVATGKPADDDYQLDGRTFRIQRGILDATVDFEGHHYRLLGVHLKSKREVEEADQEEMRRNEAHLLRSHIEQILGEDPEVRLVVYGDLNDTRRSSSVRAIQGAYNSPGFLTALRLADSRGHFWTHHWDYQDVYSRFDYVLVSRGALPHVDFDASRILDPEDWRDASDHRALLTVFR